jgi:hypothetical protein
VLQSVHRLHPPVARFCRALAAELGHATQCNAYITPGGEHQGFDFHHDTHDVFVLQVSGRKRWIVHEPVVRLPLSSQPQAGRAPRAGGRAPLLDVELEAGDALYLPRGYVHAALTTDEHSVHLTVGVLSTTWHDVLTDVVTLAGREEQFRDALPLQPAAGLAEALPDLLRRAAGWLEALPPADLEAVVARRLARAVPVEPQPLLAVAAAVRDLGPATPLRPRQGLAVDVAVVDDRLVLGLPGATVDLPAFTEPAVRRLLERPCTPADLQLGGPGRAGRPGARPPAAARGRRPARVGQAGQARPGVRAWSSTAPAARGSCDDAAAVICPSRTCSAQWQATVCAGASSRSRGTSSSQRVGCRNGQRVWKRQPDGGAAGEGRSPASRIRSRWSSTSGSGTGWPR